MRNSRRLLITEKLDKEVAAFNKKFQPGDVVKIRRDNGEVVETIVKLPASILAGHTAVGWFEGIRGAYALDRVVTK